MQYSTFGEPCKRKDGYKTAVREQYSTFLAEFYCEAVAGMIISWIRNRKCKDRAFAQEAIIAILRDSLRGVVQAEQENH